MKDDSTITVAQELRAFESYAAGATDKEAYLSADPRDLAIDPPAEKDSPALRLWGDLFDFSVHSLLACAEPAAYVFRVELVSKHGKWQSMLPSAEAVRYFLQGIDAWEAIRPRPSMGQIPAKMDDPMNLPEVQHRLRVHGLHLRCAVVVADPAQHVWPGPQAGEVGSP